MPVIPDAQEDEAGASLQPVSLGKEGSLCLRSLPCQCAGSTHSSPGLGLRLSCVPVWLYVLLGFFVWFGLFMKVLEYLLFLFIYSQDSLIKDNLIRSPDS